jgi:amino acid transporter
MNDIFGSVIAIVAILSTIALPIGLGVYFALRTANHKHKERMEMINQGLMPPSDDKEIPNRLKTLKNAVLLIGVGVGVGIGILIVKILNLREDEGFWVIAPIVLLFLGISHLIYFFMSKNYNENEVD